MPVTPALTTEDLEFDLPHELVAQRPAATRGGSRLLVCHGAGSDASLAPPEAFDETFLDQLRPGDLVVANDSRVLRARIRIRRSTGGQGELLLLEAVGEHTAAPAAAGRSVPPPVPGTSRWIAMARPSRKYRERMQVRTSRGDQTITMVERTGDQTWHVDVPATGDQVPSWLDRVGELPLPPYITAHDGAHDERYQTVHARVDGSVAAPTAGLHMSAELWQRVEETCEVAHVTLHVGAGTFLPVNEGALADHVMHHERYDVPAATDAAVRRALSEGRRVVAVGTTACRTLEHVYAGGMTSSVPTSGSTDLFIVPGHSWACVGALVTNFHLPRSTLVALVMAFHGIEETRAAYAFAIDQRMRFYSFGDAMFLHG